METGSVSRRQVLARAAGALGCGAIVACGPQAGGDTAKPAIITPGTAPAAAPPAAAEGQLDIRPRGVGAWGGGRLTPFPNRYSPGLKIRWGFTAFQTTPPPGAKDTPADNVALHWLEDQTGVWFDVAYRADTNQAWATAMASGDLPEVMWLVNPTVMSQLLSGGALEDITDVFESIASPLVKERSEYRKNNVIWGPMLRKGRIYGVPYAGSGVPSVWWIRQDLLDKVGLAVPKTVDDFRAVATALKKAGLAEIPIHFGPNARVSWFGSMDPVFGAFGAIPGIWMKDPQGGGIAYGSTLDANRDALDVLRQWYADGLISKEFPTKNSTRFKADIDAGLVGLYTIQASQWQVDNLLRNVPSARLSYAAGPVGPGGKRGRAGPNRHNNTFHAFRRGIERKKIEAVLQVHNWVTQRQADSVKNADYVYFSVYRPVALQFEGYDYVWDGDKMAPGPTGAGAGGWARMAEPQHSTRDYLEMLQRMDQIAAKEPGKRNPFEQLILSLPDTTAPIRLALETEKDNVDNEFDGGVPGPAMTEKWGDLQKLEDEWFTKFIVGDAPINSFRSFVDEWRRRGGTEVTREVNDWLNSRG